MFNEMSRCICITFECIYFQETFSLHVASTKCVPATMDVAYFNIRCSLSSRVLQDFLFLCQSNATQRKETLAPIFHKKNTREVEIMGPSAHRKFDISVLWPQHKPYPGQTFMAPNRFCVLGYFWQCFSN